MNNLSIYILLCEKRYPRIIYFLLESGCHSLQRLWYITISLLLCEGNIIILADFFCLYLKLSNMGSRCIINRSQITYVCTYNENSQFMFCSDTLLGLCIHKCKRKMYLGQVFVSLICHLKNFFFLNFGRRGYPVIYKRCHINLLFLNSRVLRNHNSTYA